MSSLELRKAHPEWYHATDYKWLRGHRCPKVDTSRWNMLDDQNRRNVANWSDNDFTDDSEDESDY